MQSLHCTVCTWFGRRDEAESAPRVPKTELPPHLVEIQDAYEEVQRSRAKRGHPMPPPCPSCGHHLAATRRLGASKAS